MGGKRLGWEFSIVLLDKLIVCDSHKGSTHQGIILGERSKLETRLLTESKVPESIQKFIK